LYMNSPVKLDGFWIVQVATTEGVFGGGVAFLQNGKVYGGDSGYVFLGGYSQADGSDAHVNATLRVEPFIKGFLSIFKTVDIPYTLNLFGSYTSDEILAQGTVEEFPTYRFSAKLTRKAGISL